MRAEQSLLLGADEREQDRAARPLGERRERTRDARGPCRPRSHCRARRCRSGRRDRRSDWARRRRDDRDGPCRRRPRPRALDRCHAAPEHVAPMRSCASGRSANVSEVATPSGTGLKSRCAGRFDERVEIASRERRRALRAASSVTQPYDLQSRLVARRQLELRRRSTKTARPAKDSPRTASYG